MQNSNLDKNTCAMICPIASGMLGICLTTIGLIRVVITLSKAQTLADDLLSVDAILFLIASLSSYVALRMASTRRLHRLEKVADVSFICGMVLIAAVCVFITYWIS